MKQDPVYYKSYYERNKARKLALGSRWYRSVKSNPESAAHFRSVKNGYQRQKYQDDPSWRIRISLKKVLSRLIRGGNSDEKCWNLCGCNREQLKRHLEVQFDRGMTWDNYGLGGWVVDHIRPCCKFNLTDKNQRDACFHFSNLQPLWYDQNRKKSITDVTA